MDGVWGEFGLVATVESVATEAGLFCPEGACCNRLVDGNARMMARQSGTSWGWLPKPSRPANPEQAQRKLLSLADAGPASTEA